MNALSPLLIAALIFAFIGIASLIGAISAFRSRRVGTGLVGTLVGLLLLAVAALSVTVSVATQGYQALTREVVAATITTISSGPQAFRAVVRFPDGRTAEFDLVGDELYVDAHILKWHPVLNVVGLHTAYELDRISGRYRSLEDERNGPRAVYSLARERPVDMFDLVRKYRLLTPLVDAEYGSATYTPVSKMATYEVRVSTSGLLLRQLASGAR